MGVSSYPAIIIKSSSNLSMASWLWQLYPQFIPTYLFRPIKIFINLVHSIASARPPASANSLFVCRQWGTKWWKLSENTQLGWKQRLLKTLGYEPLQRKSCSTTNKRFTNPNNTSRDDFSRMSELWKCLFVPRVTILIISGFNCKVRGFPSRFLVEINFDSEMAIW